MKARLSWIDVGGWMLLTLVGMLFAGGFHFPGGYGSPWLSQARAEFDLTGLVGGFVFGAVSGLFLAGLPALLLRAWGQPARRWLGYNLLAYGLIHAVADAFPYRPLVIVGGGLVVALCQFLALRRQLTHPYAWLPVAAGAWWLGFGLTAGPTDYNLIVITLLQGAATGLALKLWLIPAERPSPLAQAIRSQNRPRQVLIIVGGLLAVIVVLIGFALLTGLTGLISGP